MNNLIKINNSGGGFKYYLGKHYYTIDGESTTASYTIPYFENCYLICNTFQYSNSSSTKRATLAINGTTMDWLHTEDDNSSPYLKNNCFIQKVSEGDAYTLKLYWYYGISYDFVFTINKPNLIASLAVSTDSKTVTVSNKKDLLVFFLPGSNAYYWNISGAEYVVSSTVDGLSLVFIPKSNNEVTIKVNHVGAMNIFEI